MIIFERKWAPEKKNNGRMMGAPPIFFFLLRKWAPQKKKKWAAPIFWQSDFWAPITLLSLLGREVSIFAIWLV